jgi:L-aspartate oxidase
MENKFAKDILSPEVWELKNMLVVAKLITSCASRRKESRGLHYNVDFPNPDDKNFRKDTIVTKDEVS